MLPYMEHFHLTSIRLALCILSRALIGLMALACLSLISAAAWQMTPSRRERLATANISVSNIVLAAEQQAQDTVRQADNTLGDLVERVARDGMEVERRARLAKPMAQDLMNVDGIAFRRIA